jgi:hypothetical protein
VDNTILCLSVQSSPVQSSRLFLLRKLSVSPFSGLPPPYFTIQKNYIQVNSLQFVSFRSFNSFVSLLERERSSRLLGIIKNGGDNLVDDGVDDGCTGSCQLYSRHVVVWDKEEEINKINAIYRLTSNADY